MVILLYHPRALKFLQKIPHKEQNKVLKKLEILLKNPFARELNIKKLINTKRSYRLRIGNLRVIFEIDKEKKVVYINDIGFRGSIYS